VQLPYSTTSLTPGVWTHVAVTRRASDGLAKIYINGVEEVSGNMVTTPSATSYPMTIAGSVTMHKKLNGQMDEVRIWNDVRTQAEITANMNTELTGSEANLVAYYKFNEPDTNTVASNFAATGAVYDGTLTNMAGTEWTTSTAFATDVTAPTLSTVTIASNNSTSTKAKVGDVVTLTITASEALNANPVVTIAGNAATETNTSGNNYTATYTMQSGDTEGTVAFTVDFTDSAGNAGTQVTSLTGGSGVTFDKTAPTISSVTADWGAYLTEVEDDTSKTVTVVTDGAEDGQTVTLSLNGTDYTSTVSSNATTITVTAAGLQALTNNTDYTLTTNVSDAAGNAATAHTATTFKALNNPSANNALDFDGVDDYVSVPAINLNDDVITIETWVNPDDISAFKGIVTTRAGTSTVGLYMREGGAVIYNWNDELATYSFVTGINLVANEWAHLALVVDDMSVVVYKNGVAGNVHTYNNSNEAWDGEIRIGDDDHATRHFDGKMDEVRVWDDIRTQSEIQDNMHTELNGEEANLVAYYKFNEPDTNTISSNFAAATGASYDGTLTNMTGDEWTTSTVFDFSWDGSTDNDWSTAANWSSNSVPTPVNNLTIPTGLSNYPTIATGTTANSKTISMASGTSLLAIGTATLSGDITYTRGGLGTTAWHLLAPPVAGETVGNIITNTSLATGTQSSNVGFSTYNNSTENWEYYQSTDNTSTTSLDAGAGYAVLVSAADVAFTGSMPIGSVTASTSNNTNSWNLVGNPYPSYIAINSNANSPNFLSENTANLEDSFEAIYVWNASADAYQVVNNASDALQLSPGQGFFVKTASGISSVTFTESLQGHQTSETFYRPTATPTVILTARNNISTKTTTLKYLANSTAGLDVGYDAGAFDGLANNFALNTHLVTDNQGIDFTLQALSTEAYETSIVPVSFTAVAGTAVVFTSTTTSLPEGMMVFLEDRQANVFTRLDEAGSNYTIALATAEAGIGRFYLHTSVENRLGVATVDFTNVSIYATDSNTLRITGLTATAANIQIFDILGRQLLDQDFEANRVNDITVPNLVKANVYLVKVSSATGSITKKIFFN